MSDKTETDHFKGWLWKWTNYIKGYQRRWFVLSNGLLSYYRSQAEMAHTCRGTINLAGAYIATEDSCNFIVSNGGAQAFHLKASSEVERQRWVTALELAKVKASQMMDSEDDSSDNDSDILIVEVAPDDEAHTNPTIEMDKNDLYSTLKLLTSKLDDLVTCNDLISKHGSVLQRALSELEISDHSQPGADTAGYSSKFKNVSERATLFRITSTAMIKACTDFLQLAQTQGKRWHKAIVHEREQRIRLQDTVEVLAKQHNTLERAIQGETGPPRSGVKEIPKAEEEEDASDEDDEFVDASDKAFNFEVVATHKKNLSGSSAASLMSGSSAKEETPEHVKELTGTLVRKQDQRVYRTSIPEKPNYSLNLWSIMKNCIGKDLSKIPMPVNFNEPLSFLQRICEDLEYSSLLDLASKCTSSQEQMSYLVAFSVSTYASTLYRIGKPFNPLLGETYEFDRRDDLGFKVICEQVSHHPPVAAMYAESANFGPNSGWSYWIEYSLTSKFRGKYMNVNPLGRVHVKFNATGHHYSWHKVTTTVHNIIVGKLWVDQSGDAEIVNHKTGDYCKHKYFAYSYFSRDTPRKVSGIIMDKNDKPYYVVSGTWDSHMDCAKIESVNNTNRSKPLYKTQRAKRLWQKNALPIRAEKMYFFSSFALTLNDDEPGIAPTDSRLRPDQKMMEKANWDRANELKLALEDAQRKRRRQREAEATAKKAAGQAVEPYKPLWFAKKKCEYTNELSYVFNGKYWKHKESQDWSKCVPIFQLSAAPAIK